MRLTTIGTGTASPSPTRVSAGHLVEAGGVMLLLDCGSGVVHRMASLGIAWGSITHLAISHFHNDHISDLSTLIFAWKYGDLPPRSAPVDVIGPPGTDDLFTRLAAAFGEWMREPGFPLRIHELPSGSELVLDPVVTLAVRKVPHTDESVAYSISDSDRRVVYTGDMGYDPTFGSWAAGCDVLLAECSLAEPMAIHLTPGECGTLAEAARPGLLALTHFYPPVERVDIRARVAERFTGAVVLTTDGWSTEIEDR